MSLQYQFVQSDSQLTHCCQLLAGADLLAVDTEFVRTRSFWAALGLIQLHAEDRGIWIIDPLACSDLGPLKTLLRETPRLLMHAASEDLQVLSHALDVVPQQLFDTQVALAFLGQGPSLGYAAMVQQFAGVTLGKEEARTDWLARPLSERQLQYAAADVSFLPDIYHALCQALEQEGEEFTRYVLSEGDRMCQRALQAVLPEQAYRDVKNSWRLSPAKLAVLRELAAWRETECQRRDMARNFVIRDEALIQLTLDQPRNVSELITSGVHPVLARRSGDVLIQAIRRGQGVPVEQQPRPIKRLIDLPDNKQAIARLRQAVSETAAAEGVPAEVLASKRMLGQYLHWFHDCRQGLKDQDKAADWPEVIKSWRGVLLRDALASALE